MGISKFEYSQKIGEYGEQLTKAADAYADYSNTANFKTEEDVEKFKRGWLLLVDDFRIIQSNINELEIPKGYEVKGNELRGAYQRYVDYIEEKTMKFSAQTMKSGEIDMIQKLEIQESKRIKEITVGLTKEMFLK